MSKINQRVELVANFLLIVVAVVCLTILSQQYFFNSSTISALSKSKEETLLNNNSKIEIPDVQFSEYDKTLILALQTGCHFCSESAPFYQKLQETVKGKNIKLVAVLPSDVSSSQEYLKKLGLSNIEPKELPLNSLQVSGTPTLVLVNAKGEIIDSWVGKLNSEKESEVLNKL